MSFDIRGTKWRGTRWSSPQVQRSPVAAILNRHPDWFPSGTDTVAPAGPARYYAVFDLWAPVWKQLNSDASLKVRRGPPADLR